MPFKIIDGDTIAELIFTCPVDQDLRRDIAPHTTWEDYQESYKFFWCRDRAEEELQEDTWCESNQVCMCVNEDVTRPYTSSVIMRYDVEVSTCSETEEIESILLAVD